MTHDAHERAQELILAADDMTAADQRWLQEHLGGCNECGALARRAETVRGALRSVPIMADPGMVEATRRRALNYAHELQERESRRWLIIVAVAFSIVLTAATLPLAWISAEWIAGSAGWSVAAIVLLFLGAYFLPTIVAAAAALSVAGERRQRVTWLQRGEL